MPTITYLVGPPASGKRTIGLELSAMTGAALIDNHLINDPILTAFGADGRTPLPQWIWDLVAQVRQATLTTVSRSAPTTSHIFTNYLSDRPTETQALDQLRAIAAERQADFLPVWLTCPEAELARRVTLPARATRLKMRDPDHLRQTLRTKGVLPAPTDALVLDTSTMQPSEAAKRITDWHAGQRTDARS